MMAQDEQPTAGTNETTQPETAPDHMERSGIQITGVKRTATLADGNHIEDDVSITIHLGRIPRQDEEFVVRACLLKQALIFTLGPYQYAMESPDGQGSLEDGESQTDPAAPAEEKAPKKK